MNQSDAPNALVAAKKQSSPTVLIVGSLIVLALAAFFPVFRADFILFDDPFYVTKNPPVSEGLSWSTVRWAFAAMHASNWHPITWLSHALDCELFGLRPGGHHATGLVLHILNTTILFLLMRRLTGAVWRSVFVAALFAVHPMHVESVAWISERKDVLSLFFGLLTLWAYSIYAQKPESQIQGVKARFSYALALVLFALGLMSKPMLVTLPFLMLLLDFWPLRRMENNAGCWMLSSIYRLILEKLPFLILAAGSCVITLLAQSKGGSVAPVSDVTFPQRLANSVIAYGWYVFKLIWPVDLAIIHPLFRARPVEQIVTSAALMTTITAVVIWQIRRRPQLFVGWLWFVGTLVPVIGLVQVGMQAYADRYTYLPFVGLFIIVAWLGAEVARISRASQFFIGSIAVLAIAVCGVLTNIQSRYWKDSETVFERAVSVTDYNFIALNQLGYTAAQRGDYDRAISYYQAALNIAPQFAEALNNLGYAYLQQTNLDLALKSFGEAVKFNPKNLRMRNNFATALHQSGDYTNAIAEYRAILRGDPKYAEAYYNLANSLAAVGESTNSLASYQRAIELQRNYPEAYLNLGYELLRLGRRPEAKTSFERALASNTNFANAHYALASVASDDNDLGGETTHLRAFLEAKPDHAVARTRLVASLAAQGRKDEALVEAKETIRRHPDHAPAYYYLGGLTGDAGDIAEAIRCYERAVELKPDYPEALNNLAWLLASHPDATFRDGARAVELARRACELTENKAPILIGTLAAAYAEAGRFEEAVRSGELAIQVAEAAGDTALAQKNQELIELYRAGKPFRQPK